MNQISTSTAQSSQAPSRIEDSTDDKDINIDLNAISDLYREVTAALMTEHGYIVSELESLFQVFKQ